MYEEAKLHFGVDGGVYAKDDRTLVVELNAPTPYFLELTAFYPAYPVPRWAVEKYAGSSWFLPSRIVSNGAFRMTEWLVGSRIRLERSQTYWDHEHVKLQTVDVLPIENTTAELIAKYLAGRLATALKDRHQFVPELMRVEVEESVGVSAIYEWRG